MTKQAIQRFYKCWKAIPVCFTNEEYEYVKERLGKGCVSAYIRRLVLKKLGYKGDKR